MGTCCSTAKNGEVVPPQHTHQTAAESNVKANLLKSESDSRKVQGKELSKQSSVASTIDETGSVGKKPKKIATGTSGTIAGPATELSVSHEGVAEPSKAPAETEAFLEEKTINDMPPRIQKIARSAVKGDKEAQFNLGYAYDVGAEGMAILTSEAIKWYRLSALQGHAAAQNNLGVLYATGHRGRSEKDLRQALHWYEQAASNENPNAQFHAGLIYLRGDGLPAPDESRAFKLLHRSAKQNHAMAEAVVGTMYLKGVGTEANAKKAVKYLKRAAAKNDALACYNLAIMNAKGWGGQPVDMERALAYLGMAKECGNDHIMQFIDKFGLDGELQFY